MHFQEWKKGLLTQFTVVTLCTKGFLEFHQHKMTIENNFITIDKIDTCPAFHLIYVSTTEPSNVNQHPPVPVPVTVSLWSLSYTANVLLIISIDFANVQLSPYGLTILFKGYYLYKLQLIWTTYYDISLKFL